MEIPFPYNESEFDVQHRMMSAIEALGLHAKGNVKIPRNLSPIGRGCVFDIVVYDKKQKALAIVECKKRIRGTRNETFTKQYHKYNVFGYPLLYCFKDTQQEVIDAIKKLIAG